MGTESNPGGNQYGTPPTSGPIAINPNDYIGATNSYPGQRRPTSAEDLAQGPMMAAAYNYGLSLYPNDPVKASLAAVNYRYKNDPTYKLPDGFIVKNGQVIVDPGSWISRNWYNIVTAAVGGLAGAGILAAFAPAAGAAVAPAVSAAEADTAGGATLASAATGVGGAAADVGAGAAAGSAAADASAAAAAGSGAAGASGVLGATATVPTAAGTVAGGTGLTAAGLASDGSTVAATGAAGGAGAATTAATAGGAAKAAGSWLGPAIGAGASVVGNIVGAKIQSDATTQAAQIQAQSIKDALDFAKQEYATKVAALSPYSANGMASNDRMAQLLDLPARSGTTATGTPLGGPTPGATIQPQPSAGTPAAAPPTYAAPPAQSGASVLMQAPDGSQRQVAAADVQRAKDAGAVIVGQPAAAPAGNQYAKLAA